jgi:glyceraldehyde-3-phosphate dehydrogenase type I
MKTRVAINGFGRIGRMAFRIIAERSDIEVVGINDLTDTKTLAHLLKHDTNYGQFSHNVEHDDTSIIVDGVHIPVSCIKDATTLPWGNLQVDVVIESTGRFVTTEAASAHLQAGAKKVVLSAPAKDDKIRKNTFTKNIYLYNYSFIGGLYGSRGTFCPYL